MTAVMSPAMPRPEVLMRDENESRYEIIDGRRVGLPPMSILASRVASNLHAQMWHHAHSLGEALIETLFHLPLPVDRNRRPDVAFVSARAIANAPPQRGSENAWDVLPELIAQVVSPNDLAEEILERIGEYFAAGTKLVWVIYPTQRLVYVYESPSRVQILGDAAELSGGTVLPNLKIAIASLFPRG